MSESNELEGFLLLCKTSSGAQCVMVLQHVLKHPHIFVFGELLDIPSVKQLAESEHRAWFDLLKVFAYGTYADYKATPGLPELGEAETTKLRQLTLVQMASKQRILPYSLLQSSLSLPDLRTLEDLIIESIYLGLIEGHLNQKDSTLEITSAIGRDIGPNDVDNMIHQLSSWLQSTDVVLDTLRSQVSRVQAEEECKRKADAEQDEKRTRIVEEIKTNKLASGAAGAIAIAGDDAPRKKKASVDDSDASTSKLAGMFGGRR